MLVSGTGSRGCGRGVGNRSFGGANGGGTFHERCRPHGFQFGDSRLKLIDPSQQLLNQFVLFRGVGRLRFGGGGDEEDSSQEL